MNEISTIKKLLNDAKRIAKEYKKLTGKPLGITGEIAEFTAAEHLGLKLAEARQKGYDAIREENGEIVKIQIKGRSLPKGKKAARLGRIRLDAEWDVVLFVQLDEDYEPVAMYEANRSDVEKAIRQPGSKARQRGALPVSKFKAIAKQVWPVDDSNQDWQS